MSPKLPFGVALATALTFALSGVGAQGDAIEEFTGVAINLNPRPLGATGMRLPTRIVRGRRGSSCTE